MKCFVINMSGAEARLAHCEREFARVGLTMTRFPACTPDMLPHSALVKGLSPIAYRNWTGGEIGCFLSQVTLWNEIARGDDLFGAIFEDDVVLNPKIAQVVHAQAQFPSDADIVKLETVMETTLISRTVARSIVGIDLVKLLGTHMGGGGYILSKRYASKLIELIETSNAPADVMLFDLPWFSKLGATIYQAVPAVVMQETFLPKEQLDRSLSSTLTIERWHELLKRQPLSVRLRNFLGRISRKMIGYLVGRYLVVPFAGRNL